MMLAQCPSTDAKGRLTRRSHFEDLWRRVLGLNFLVQMSRSFEGGEGDLEGRIRKSEIEKMNALMMRVKGTRVYVRRRKLGKVFKVHVCFGEERRGESARTPQTEVLPQNPPKCIG